MKKLLLLVLICLPFASFADEAYFAGGCFWCMESDFQDVDGVEDVVSGFTGGTLKNPRYNGNHQGHYEAVKISYDPAVISYQELLNRYWVNIDPFDDYGQFCDKGFSYRAVIFYQNSEQKSLAEASRSTVVQKFDKQHVVTQVLPVTQFWPVENYHQDYYKKNSIRYNYYRYRCGRDARLKDIWGDAVTH